MWGPGKAGGEGRLDLVTFQHALASYWDGVVNGGGGQLAVPRHTHTHTHAHHSIRLDDERVDVRQRVGSGCRVWLEMLLADGPVGAAVAQDHVDLALGVATLVGA